MRSGHARFEHGLRDRIESLPGTRPSGPTRQVFHRNAVAARSAESSFNKEEGALDLGACDPRENYESSTPWLYTQPKP